MKLKNLKILPVLFVLCGLSVSFSFSQSQKAIESISVDELKNHMHFLASDFLKGRVSYETEYNIATEYACSQFLSNGLKPIVKGEDGKLTYFQKVPLVVKEFGSNNRLEIMSGNSVTELNHIEDFKIPVMMSDYCKDEVETVFIGYGIKEEDYNWNDFSDLDIENKVVIILMDAPIKNGNPVLPQKIHDSYLSFPGFDKKLMNLAKMKQKPAAIIVLADETFLKTVPWEYLPTLNPGKNCYYGGNNNDLTITIPPLYVVKPEVQKIIFKNSDYSPENIHETGLKGYKTFQIKDLKVKMSFELLSEEKINSNNIIAYVEGTDPVLKNEFITVGAHLDHLEIRDGKIYNGADDNASGSVGVLESAEAMLMNPPKRSVMFILYTAEELGLIGSSHFVNNSPVPIKNIKFNINLDMIGRSIPENEEKKTHRVVIYDEYFNKIKQFIEINNENTINWSLDFINAKDKQGDSDHTSFYKKGIASFQFASGHHADYHQPTDDVEKIDFEKLQKITQLTYIIAYRLANLKDINFKE